MTRRIFLLGTLLTAILATAQVARAQDLAYWFSEADGGLLDLETGLVWSFDVTANAPPRGVYTYEGAIGFAGQHYSDSEWSYGYDDWRVPTKSEMADALAKGMPDELDYWAFVEGAQPLYGLSYWTATDAGNIKGVQSAWLGDFPAGTVRTGAKRSFLYGIVVRGVPRPRRSAPQTRQGSTLNEFGVRGCV